MLSIDHEWQAHISKALIENDYDTLSRLCSYIPRSLCKTHCPAKPCCDMFYHYTGTYPSTYFSENILNKA